MKSTDDDFEGMDVINLRTSSTETLVTDSNYDEVKLVHRKVGNWRYSVDFIHSPHCNTIIESIHDRLNYINESMQCSNYSQQLNQLNNWTRTTEQLNS